MDQLRTNIRILFIVVLINQVFGNPMYVWSPQPDCYQASDYQQSEYQQNNYQPNNYQQSGYQQQEYQQNTHQEDQQQINNQRNDYQDQSGYAYEQPTSFQNNFNYQRPSYQETLQSMIDETIRALTEIVQVTVRASKQELSSLAKMFFESIPSKFCSSENESEYDPNEDDNGVQYFGGQLNPSSVSSGKPLKGNLIEEETRNQTLLSLAVLSSSMQTTTSLLSSSTQPSSVTSTPEEEASATISASKNITSFSTSGETSIFNEAVLSGTETNTNTKKPTNIPEESGTEHSLDLNSTDLDSFVTTNPFTTVRSNESSTVSSLIPPSSAVNANLTSGEAMKPQIHTTLGVQNLVHSSSGLESHATLLDASLTSLSNSSTPVSTELNLTSEQSVSESNDETFSTLLPNTHVTTTLIPSTIPKIPQNDSKMQSISSAQTMPGNLQLNTTSISSTQNSTTSISPDVNSTAAELSNPTIDSTKLEYYEQAPGNDVDSDELDFPRNSKL